MSYPGLPPSAGQPPYTGQLPYPGQGQYPGASPMPYMGSPSPYPGANTGPLPSPSVPYMGSPSPYTGTYSTTGYTTTSTYSTPYGAYQGGYGTQPSSTTTTTTVNYVTIPQSYSPAVYNYPCTYSPFSPFAIPYGVPPHVASRMMEASAIFRTYDRDCSGYLNKKEWKRGMHHLGYHMAKHDRKMLFHMVDRDHSGKISEREFCEFWASRHPY